MAPRPRSASTSFLPSHAGTAPDLRTPRTLHPGPRPASAEQACEAASASDPHSLANRRQTRTQEGGTPISQLARGRARGARAVPMSAGPPRCRCEHAYRRFEGCGRSGGRWEHVRRHRRRNPRHRTGTGGRRTRTEREQPSLRRNRHCGEPTVRLKQLHQDSPGGTETGDRSQPSRRPSLRADAGWMLRDCKQVRTWASPAERPLSNTAGSRWDQVGVIVVVLMQSTLAAF